MNEHDSIRDLLSLAAAEALDAHEQRRVEAHLRECAACRRELDGLMQLAAALRRVPTPQPPAALVERSRAAAERILLEQAERRWDYRVVVFLLLFGWTLTLAVWPIVRLVSGGVFEWLGVTQRNEWYLLAGYTLLGWLTAGVATLVLGLRQRAMRRAT